MISWKLGLLAALFAYIAGRAQEAGRKAQEFEKNSGATSDPIYTLQDEEDRQRGAILRKLHEKEEAMGHAAGKR